MSIEVDRNSGDSLTRQIQTAIKCRITEGILRPGGRLPSSRQLASDIGVSRSVAVEAYNQLTAEGYLVCTQGSGTRVADIGAPLGSPAGNALREADPLSAAWDLRTGRANVADFPRLEWLACYRTVLASVGSTELDYPAVNGVPALRESLAGYLGRSRNVRTTPERVLVTAGFAQGLSLLCEALPLLGIRTLAVEDPGHSGQLRFIEQNGMHTVPIRVDAQGIDVERLRASGARAVLVTPAHQFPTGVTMSTDRRTALVSWAEEVDGLIIEDDYDGEFWFEPTPRPGALQYLAPRHTVHAGTTSKTLVPGLRLGWLAVPAHLGQLLTRVRARRDLGSDGITQRAYAELIDSGMLERHLRRVHSRYRSRREVLLQAVAQHLPQVRVTGSAAGLHAFLELPDGVDESALVAAALRRSVLVHGAQRYQFAPGRRPAGLVAGYAGLSPAGLSAAVFALRDALHEQPAVG